MPGDHDLRGKRTVSLIVRVHPEDKDVWEEFIRTYQVKGTWGLQNGCESLSDLVRQAVREFIAAKKKLRQPGRIKLS